MSAPHGGRDAPAFGRVAIVGSGLIGGSVALALRKRGAATTITVFDRESETAARARALGMADEVCDSIEAAARDADLVVVATPVSQAATVFAQVASGLSAHAIVTDVGSTKRDVIAAARGALGAAFARFVPGHPIAGRETHGPDAASADLFEGRRVLLTPLAETDAAAVVRVEQAWTACGAVVERLAADVHDRVLASVSHLPHLLAYALVAQIADAPDADVKFALAGGGFRDFTRIAASSPPMWRDIVLANADLLLDDLDAYRAILDRLRAALIAADGAALDRVFGVASDARRTWREDR